MNQLISIVGPTAVGKTQLSLFLARQLQTEIISTDSRQIYQGMDIGTAKPSLEELHQAPHHFINHLSPEVDYNAGIFEKEADALIKQLFHQHRHLITVGGSTLYINALWNGIDPMPKISHEIRNQLRREWEAAGLGPLLEELAKVDPETFDKIDRQNPVRILRALEVYRTCGTPISVFRKNRKLKSTHYQLIKIGLQEERAQLYERINQRVDQMFEEGLIAEVEGLLSAGISREVNSMQSIGYREVVQYLNHQHSLEEAKRLVKRNSRRYAKRQMTWFRRDKDIKWFKAGQKEEVLQWLVSQAPN
ncbi:MAG: tRNA (adenosine(37)-N6)-dimethylallyltransferase MiaA [Bacteroidota bacterium]